MRLADAPPAGWYPDPAGRAGLRWWDGLDWTDHRRPPLPMAPQQFHGFDDEAEPPPADAPPASTQWGIPRSAPSRADATEVVAEARRAAREEVDRAVREFTDRARDARRQFEPIITQYGDRVLRGLRLAGIAIVVLFVLWLVLQTLGQTSLLNWLGDRIDSITEGSIGQRTGLLTWRGSNP